MRNKIEELRDHMRRYWGPLQFLPMSRVISLFESFVMGHVQDQNMRRAIVTVFSSQFRARSLHNGASVELKDIEDITNHYLATDLALYRMTLFIVHLDEDQDSCEHQMGPSQCSIYDDFEKARTACCDLAEKYLDDALPGVTHTKAILEMNDGSDIFELGNCVADRYTGVVTWNAPERN